MDYISLMLAFKDNSTFNDTGWRATKERAIRMLTLYIKTRTAIINLIDIN
jgi:hypothetical protein